MNIEDGSGIIDEGVDICTRMLLIAVTNADSALGVQCVKLGEGRLLFLLSSQTGSLWRQDPAAVRNGIIA